jgi:hypothetical protein
MNNVTYDAEVLYWHKWTILLSYNTTTKAWQTAWRREEVSKEVINAVERIPFLARTWKRLRKLEVEARRIVVMHAESLAIRPELGKETIIIEGTPAVRLKCLLFPWLPQCRTDDICRIFPWLCWYCWLCPLPCKYYPPPPPDQYRVDPIMAIDAIMHHLPDLEPAKITEDEVLKAAIKVMEKKINLIRESTDSVSENLESLK